jgi:hypothetical protein
LRHHANAAETDGDRPFDFASRGEAMVRLDPHALPAQFRYGTGLPGRAAEASVLMDRHSVRVSRHLPSGIPMVLRLPVSAFEGVAYRVVVEAPEAGPRIVVELMHRDPALSVPLAVNPDLDEVVADWQAWGRVFGLPLLLVESDGTVRSLEKRLGALTVGPTRPRRRRSLLGHRRPRFLTRRRMAKLPAEPVVFTGREIIARN